MADEPTAPLGDPLPLNDDDLDILAEITEQDILAAHQFLARALSPRFRNLPLAEEVEPE